MSHMHHLIFIGLVLFCLTTPAIAREESTVNIRSGLWQGWLDSPGGPLPFGLEIQRQGQTIKAWLINGEEKTPIPETRIEGDDVIFDFIHYNSMIRATALSSGSSLQGEWRKVQGPDSETVMRFHASWTPPSEDDFEPEPRSVNEEPGGGKPKKEHISEALRLEGRWAVQFESSEDLAIGIFKSVGNDEVTGTFLTTTGDYRFLGGSFYNNTLSLSVFDGAHAFLFKAEYKRAEQTLTGEFWSRDSWHETWTATLDPEAALPDAFRQTSWNEDASLADQTFMDLEGQPVSPADAKFAGKLRIIEVFGTWCPNCNDATRFLNELDKRYRGRGLSILGLAFEMTGDHGKDAAQVRRYIDHHSITYPILVAGISDKTKATKTLGVLDRVRSYPTFIFLDETDAVKAIYTGFSGPATGAAYDKLREDFARIIEKNLGE